MFQFIYEKDKERKWEYIWCLNDPAQLPAKYSNIRIVSFLSVSHIFYLLTSKVIISNIGIEPIIPKRGKQIFINTWHGGGAYKRNQFDLPFFTKSESNYVRSMRDIRRKGTDYMISSCRAYSETASVGFNIDIDRFLPFGLPRNDKLVVHGKEIDWTLRKTLSRMYNIESQSLWVLYAPTFRGAFRKQTNIDNEVCSDIVVNSLKKRFNREVVLITRAHTPRIYLGSNEKGINNSVIDLTDYPDMQELLTVSDILITDYSSSIWDFALTGRPGFLYTPDLKLYEDDRGFYTPIEKWPYPFAVDMEEFCRIIENYDEEIAANKIRQHQELLGSYETGNASIKIWSLIYSVL